MAQKLLRQIGRRVLSGRLLAEDTFIGRLDRQD